jgi:hypothetical protein
MEKSMAATLPMKTLSLLPTMCSTLMNKPDGDRALARTMLACRAKTRAVNYNYCEKTTAIFLATVLPFCKTRMGHVRSRRAFWVLVPHYNPHSLEPRPGVLSSGEASVAGKLTAQQTRSARDKCSEVAWLLMHFLGPLFDPDPIEDNTCRPVKNADKPPQFLRQQGISEHGAGRLS